MSFKNLGIKNKLILCFLIVALLSALSSGFAILKIMDMRHNAAEISNNWLPSVSLMGGLNGAVSDVQRLALAIVLENDPGETAKLEQQLNALLKDTEEKRKVYEQSMISSPEERKLYETFAKNWQAYTDRLPALVAAGRADDFALANQKRLEIVPVWTKANDAVGELISFNKNGAEKAGHDSLAAAQSAYTWVLILSVSIAVLAIALGWLIARRIANPLTAMVARVQEVAAGNLAIGQAEITSNDEVGKLGEALNAMTVSLRTLIGKITANAEQVAASSEELTANSEQSAQAATQIAASVAAVSKGAGDELAAANETSAVVEQMSAGIQQVAANTNQVAAQSARAAEKAKEGGAAVDKAVSQMGRIENTVNTSAGVVAKLGERSKEIGQIVDAISGIAGQTNLLALNAAIEAARAGEQGRGFAVVAEEVRKLAEQSQEAAKQIAALIGEIQGDTDKAVLAMNDGTREVRTGADVVGAAGAAFKEIVGLVSQVSGQVREISAAIQQMASGSQQIVDAVKKIDGLGKKSAGEAQSVSAATEEQLASMEEIATSSQSLATLAQELQAAVARFRV